ncbi:MAG: DUF4258 domain-containing protein [Timaviella obliquedivisa GSE-PSE-MK23-08B]|nr:DUF4258 domain-containing protein [Timaviella obliquedivisa GSE-PSE-MK23-08B]
MGGRSRINDPQLISGWRKKAIAESLVVGRSCHAFGLLYTAAEARAIAMFEKILKVIREKVRLKQYVMTLHAEEEMADDAFSIYDVESGVLTGEILECQKDRVARESKYRIQGEAPTGEPIEIIVKFSPTGKVVIITVYVP